MLLSTDHSTRLKLFFVVGINTSAMFVVFIGKCSSSNDHATVIPSLMQNRMPDYGRFANTLQRDSLSVSYYNLAGEYSLGMRSHIS